MKGHTGPVKSVKFAADGKHLITASDDKLVKMLNVHKFFMNAYKIMKKEC